MITTPPLDRILIHIESLKYQDCYTEKNRDASGNLVVNRTRFPSGIKALADYVGFYQSKNSYFCDIIVCF